MKEKIALVFGLIFLMMASLGCEVNKIAEITSFGDISGVYVNPANRSEYLELKKDGSFIFKSLTIAEFLQPLVTVEGKWRRQGKEVILTYTFIFPSSARGKIEDNTITVIHEDGNVWAEGWVKEEVTKKGGQISLTVGARHTVDVIEHYLIEPETDPRLYLDYRNISSEPIKVRIQILWLDETGWIIEGSGQENNRGPISPGEREKLVYRPRFVETVASYRLQIHASEWGRPELPYPEYPEVLPEKEQQRASCPRWKRSQDYLHRLRN